MGWAGVDGAEHHKLEELGEDQGWRKLERERGRAGDKQDRYRGRQEF